jgi:hypothetical protein
MSCPAIVSPLSCDEEANRLPRVSNTFSVPEFNLNTSSRAEEGCFFPSAIVSPLSNNEGATPLSKKSDARLQHFSDILNTTIKNWTSKDGSATESPLYKYLKSEKEKERGKGFLRISPGGHMTDDDSHNILLCLAAFSGLKSYGLGIGPLIAYAFDITSRRNSQIIDEATKEIVTQEEYRAPQTNTESTSTQISSGDQILFETMPLAFLENNEVHVVNIVEDATNSYHCTPNGKELMADGLIHFRKIHSKRGTRLKAHEHAVQAIEAAAFLMADNFEKIQDVQKLLGVRTKKIGRMIESARAAKNGNFKPRQRKIRSDFTRPEAEIACTGFSHDPKYARIDSNSNRSHKVKGDKKRHTQRVWTCGSTIAKRYKEFLNSKHFQRYQEHHPGQGICEYVFRTHVCKCVHLPTDNSCVDEEYTAVEWMLADWSRNLEKPEIKAFEEICNCEWHVELREKKQAFEFLEMNTELPQLLFLDDSETADVTMTSLVDPRERPEPALALPPGPFLDETCCPRMAELDLGYDDEIPELIPYDCVFGDCPNCGYEKKFKFFNCPMLQQSTTIVASRQWVMKTRRGETQSGKRREQKEETVLYLKIKLVLSTFEEILESAREHHWNTEWGSLMRMIDIRTVKEFGCVKMRDFSASPDLKANNTLNSSESNHCVYEIFLAIYDPRNVEVIDLKGDSVTHRICECEAFHVIGETISSGKKNDAAFDIPVNDLIIKILAKRIVDIAKRKLKELENELSGRIAATTEEETGRLEYLGKKVAYDPNDDSLDLPLEVIVDWTDNCCAQYKCRKNFLTFARYPEKYPGLDQRHRYPEKEQFKTEADGEGKCGKQNVKTNEKEGVRSPEGYGMAKTISGPHGIAKVKTDHKKLEEEKSPKLLERGMTTITRRSFIYVTEDAIMYDEIKDKHDELIVLLLNRDALDDMRVLDKNRSHSLHEVIPCGCVGDKKYKLISNLRPCSCIRCREFKAEAPQCKYKEYLEPREHIVMSKADESPDLQEVSDEEYQLNLLYPGEKITVPFLNDKLDDYNLIKTGRKQQKIDRLVKHLYGDSNLGFQDEGGADHDDTLYSDHEFPDDSESDNSLDDDERSVAKSTDTESSDPEKSAAEISDADSSDADSSDEEESDDKSSDDSANESIPDNHAQVSSDDSTNEYQRSNFPGTSVTALKAMCKEFKLKGYSNKRRPELVDMLNEFMADC